MLIVHLQRLVYNFDTFQNDKINTRFEFPPLLNLKEFSYKEVMQKEGRPHDIMYSEVTKHLMTIDEDEYIYKLVGVNIHIGTAENGHYYSLINTRRGGEESDENKYEWAQTDKDNWKQFEDDKVKHYSYSDLKLDSFGGTQQSNMNDNEMNAYLANSGGSFGKNAYMLVYERKKKKQLMEIVTSDDKQLSASLDCANTATSRAAETPLPIEQSKEEAHPCTKMVDFRKVSEFVPSWIKEEVEEDN